MSLIQKIKSRRLDDLINEGSRLTVTGTATGPGSTTIQTVGPERFLIVTGYQFSSTASTPTLVTLSLDDGTTTVDLFNGYVGGGQTVDHSYSLGDWIFGDLEFDLVLTIDGSETVAYTVDGRVSAAKEPLGYIQRVGTPDHANPFFGLESGKDRGQSEF